jgi:hypothetical protein
MRCRDVEGDDVNTLAYTENISLVLWLPEGGCVAKVSLGSHKELKSNVFWGGGPVN